MQIKKEILFFCEEKRKMDATTTSSSSAESMEITGENGFLFDERLGEAVRKHRCLYDKNEPGYKDVETTVMNAWNEVAQETNLANGETAKRLFCNLKKRFLKKRLAFRKANGLGRSKEHLQRAKEAVDSYSFLTWLTPHIRLRETKSNIARRTQYADSYEDDDVYLSEPGDINIDDTYFEHCKEEIDPDARNSSEDANCDRPTFTVYSAKERLTPHHSPHPLYTYKKRNSPIKGHAPIMGHGQIQGHVQLAGHSPPVSHSPLSGVPNIPGHHIITTNTPIITKDKWTKRGDDKLDFLKLSPHDRNDNDCDLFGQLVSAELKTLDIRTKTILKHKIQTLIFEAKIAQLPCTTTRIISPQDSTGGTERPHSPLQQRTWDDERYSSSNHSMNEATNPSSPQHTYKIIALQ